MLRLKLKSLLRSYGLTEGNLADAIADIVTERQHVTERYLRYLASNTTPFSESNNKRKPSLKMLGFIIRGLRHLTGQAIEVADLLEYVLEPFEALVSSQPILSQSTELAKGAVTPLPSLGHSLFDSDDILDNIKELIVQRLTERGFTDAVELFEAYSEDETSETSTVGRRRSKPRRLGTVIAMLSVFTLLLFSYAYLLRQPRVQVNPNVAAIPDPLRALSDLPIPTLIGPEGDIDQSAPVLRVLEQDEVLAYDFFLKNLVSGDNVNTGTIQNNSFPIPEGYLCPSIPYQWRVRVLGEDGWTSFSSPLTFTISPDSFPDEQKDLTQMALLNEKPEPPKLLSPIGMATTTVLTLLVEANPNIIGYGFYIRDLEADKVIYNNHFVPSNQVEVPKGLLKEGGIYQWNARQRNCHYWSEFTPVQSFSVDVNGAD